MVDLRTKKGRQRTRLTFAVALAVVGAVIINATVGFGSGWVALVWVVILPASFALERWVNHAPGIPEEF